MCECIMTIRLSYLQPLTCLVVKYIINSTRIDAETSSHSWEKGSLLTFDTRSSWGAPQTLSLRLSSADMSEDGRDQLTHTDDSGTLHYSSEVGFCWVDLRPMWTRIETSKSTFTTVMCHAQICPSDAIQTFDEHGDLITDSMPEVRLICLFWNVVVAIDTGLTSYLIAVEIRD